MSPWRPAADWTGFYEFMEMPVPCPEDLPDDPPRCGGCGHRAGCDCLCCYDDHEEFR